MSSFQTAREFYEHDSVADGLDDDLEESAYSKTILWYDSATPIFVCDSHASDIENLRFQGNADDDPETVSEMREQAYCWLLNADPLCDVCEGRLRQVISDE